jgi:type I restriction enzyme R subunit
LSPIPGRRRPARKNDFFERYSPGARQILDELLENTPSTATRNASCWGILRVPRISHHRIIRLFGNAENLNQAVHDLQGDLYAS